MAFLRMLSATVVVTLWTAASDARPPTVSDFAVCNHEAVASTGGSAMPGPRDRVKPPPPAPPTTPGGGVSARTDSTGKLIVGANDVLSEGMDATRAGDPAYAAAYRTCMAQRGITARPTP